MTRLDPGPAAGDLDSVSAGSLAFSQPLPIRDVLFLLFRGTGFSIVLDPEVSGAFSGELTDLSLREALDAVLAPAGQVLRAAPFAGGGRVGSCESARCRV